jgi:hypothetical protein
MSVQRIANRDARAHIEEREEFTGSNIEAYDTASTTGTDLYVVLSYGAHFPMYIAESTYVTDGVVNWYGNKDKWGRTTTKHQSQCMPYHESITWFDTKDMIVIAKHGITGLAVGA